MAMLLTPDMGVPLLPQQPITDLYERVKATAYTADILAGEGLHIAKPTLADIETAAVLAEAYAENPEKASRAVSNTRASTMTPASLMQTRAILDEFGTAVVRHSVEIRHLVTNKLLLESENPDPRVRIRALELLGKITDVGLFTERSEVLITHQSTDDLRRKLREKFDRLLDRDTRDATDVVVIGDTVIDLDKELGIVPNE